MNLIKATDRHISIIQSLSQSIWPHTFKDILSSEQIEYMMNMMYRTEALKAQINEQNHHYLLAEENGEYLGYVSYELDYKSQTVTKVHKIYVLPTLQGKGIGRFFIDNVSQIALRNGNNTLSLNVNKYNKAIGFYQHLGFEIADKEEIDIGNGFIMDDYVMNKKLSSNFRL